MYGGNIRGAVGPMQRIEALMHIMNPTQAFTPLSIQQIVDCYDRKLDHVVLIVGYGTRDGVDYWKILNSWGPNVGTNGCFYLESYTSFYSFKHSTNS
ncbi:putative cathepsin F [Helianthus annuus]|uniref:Cathepsin F n=1 Tax=Helianthus annuus TaxID=4232 RepID=A0A9K3JKV2_HELAN|nr:putative cathepsin F [Helianthus annuus]KAJ0613722.1 putative cathepsin F [Helianthus annuus]KAJ0617520.1 putative cathepsin F [Helianthus annuus]KAJ0638539.1 putative cathepsin F [Helianthus annuus]KAJ0776060.1 putative cathepsin F [Helianthus annuus]